MDMKNEIPCSYCGKLVIRWPHNRKYCDECRPIAYKENQAKYAKEYQKKNRDRINEYHREYYSKNADRCNDNWRKWRDSDKDGYLKQRRKNYKQDPEKYIGYQKKHYQNNREKCNDRNKAWRNKNPDLVKQYRQKDYLNNRETYQKYKESNKEYIKAKKREWVRNNRLHVRMKNRNRHALKMNAEGSHSEKEFIDICDMCNWKCVYCHEPLNKKTVTADHVIPLNNGGSNYIENILPSCSFCNSSKRDKSILEHLFFKEIRKVA